MDLLDFPTDDLTTGLGLQPPYSRRFSIESAVMERISDHECQRLNPARRRGFLKAGEPLYIVDSLPAGLVAFELGEG